MLSLDIFGASDVSLHRIFFFTRSHTELSPDVYTKRDTSNRELRWLNDAVDRVLLTYAEAAENQSENIVTGYLTC